MSWIATNRQQSPCSCAQWGWTKRRSARKAEVGTDLNNLGLLYLLSKRYDESEKTYHRALAIRIKAFGESDPAVRETMSGYISALRGLHRAAEAAQMEDRLRATTKNQSVTPAK